MLKLEYYPILKPILVETSIGNFEIQTYKDKSSNEYKFKADQVSFRYEGQNYYCNQEDFCIMPKQPTRAFDRFDTTELDITERVHFQKKHFSAEYNGLIIHVKRYLNRLREDLINDLK